MKTIKATTLTDTELLVMLDVHCCIEREHDTKAGPRVVRWNADDLRAVAADNGFQGWHTEYEIAALDIDYLVHYRGSTPMATANNALIREKGYIAMDGRNVLLDGQANAGLRPAFAVLIPPVP